MVLVSQVLADLERHPSSVYTPLDPEIKADVGFSVVPDFT